MAEGDQTYDEGDTQASILLEAGGETYELDTVVEAADMIDNETDYTLLLNGPEVRMHSEDRDIETIDDLYDLAEHYHTLRIRNTELKRQNDELEHQVIDYEQELDNLQGAFHELAQQYNDLEEENHELEGELEDYREEEAERMEEAHQYKLDKNAVGDISFDDIGGLDEQLETLNKKFMLETEYGSIMQNLENQNIGEKGEGLLLTGPPGTGKTMSMKALANEQDTSMYLIDGPAIIDKYVGESEKKLREIYEAAQKDSPAIIFIDEIDAIAPKREASNNTEVTKRVVNQLLSLMDGVDEGDEDEEIYWVATTNRKEMIDDALTRPGRFGKKIGYPRPNKEATQAIAEKYLPEATAAELTEIIGEYDDFDAPEKNSGAAIKEVVSQTAENYLLEDMKTNGQLIRELASDRAEALLKADKSTLSEDAKKAIDEYIDENGDEPGELTEEFEKHFRKNLFSKKQHFDHIPTEMFEDVVKNVYGEKQEEDSGIGFNTGATAEDEEGAVAVEG